MGRLAKMKRQLVEEANKKVLVKEFDYKSKYDALTQQLMDEANASPEEENKVNPLMQQLMDEASALPKEDNDIDALTKQLMEEESINEIAEVVYDDENFLVISKEEDEDESEEEESEESEEEEGEDEIEEGKDVGGHMEVEASKSAKGKKKKTVAEDEGKIYKVTEEQLSNLKSGLMSEAIGLIGENIKPNTSKGSLRKKVFGGKKRV